MADSVGYEPLTSKTALTALRVGCAQVGLDVSRAQLLRMGENAMYALPTERVVVRISRSEDLVERVSREVDVARWLTSLEFPSVSLAPDLPQVFRADGRLLTFWRLEADTKAQASAPDLGRILRDLHALPEPPMPLPLFDPFAAVPERIERATDVAFDDREFLRELTERLARDYKRLARETPSGFIHGDAHVANLIVTPSRVVLCDFENVAWGPEEWDLTPMAVRVQRFGLLRADYQAFALSYGRDVMEWEGFPTLRAVREVTMTSWLMQNVGESRDIAEEFRQRIDSLRQGDHVRRWRAF